LKKFLFLVQCNSSHLEWRAELSETILKWDHPRTIPAKFGLIWFRGFRGKDLNVILQIKPSMAGMVLGSVPFKIVSDSPALHSKISSKSFAQKFELKWSFKIMCNTPIFYFNFRCQIENQVSDYRLLGSSSLTEILATHLRES
jgi:hypothetical protein